MIPEVGDSLTLEKEKQAVLLLFLKGLKLQLLFSATDAC
jgi:hypothetical protein